MSPRDLRSSPDRRTAAGSLAQYVSGLLRRAGLAAGERGQERFTGLESLENRVLLAGDHPTFADVFDNPNPVPATFIELHAGSGEGVAAGRIGQSGDNDMFRFVAPANEFVTVWADTINSGGLLDSHVTVYRLGADGRAVHVIGGSSNGTLTGGTNRDGWAGFMAEAGAEYYVRVTSDKMSGEGATGDYRLRVDARPATVSTSDLAHGAEQGGSLGLAGSDTVFKLVAGQGREWDRLTTVYADGRGVLDTRLEIYDAAGRLIRTASQGGRGTDAFATLKLTPGGVYYVRVRSDQFQTAAARGDGGFGLQLGGAPDLITLDPVTRMGSASGRAGAAVTKEFMFEAQGTGRTIIAVRSFYGNNDPLVDPAVHLYNSDGVEIGFNDDLLGNQAQLEILLTGGEIYTVLVEGFDNPADGDFEIFIESNITDPVTNTNVDDHADADDFDNATPIVWGDPQDAPDYVGGGTIADRDKVVIGHGTGRIHDFGDTDLFVFTPPVDMLGGFEGKEDESEPPIWDADHRPATRLQIFMLGENGTFLAPPTFRVLDSNFEEVYALNGGVFAGDPTAFPEGAGSGMWDPASFQPNMTIEDNGYVPVGGAEGIAVWGGEAYYIEVSGGAKGRYRFMIVADTMPKTTPDPDNTGAWLDNVSTKVDAPEAGDWLNATELILTSATGDTTNVGNASGLFGTGRNLSGYYERLQLIGATADPQGPFDPFAAGDGIFILQEGGLSGIETYTDTDLFLFTAPSTGTAEVRINTTALADYFSEFITDGEDDPDNPDASTSRVEKIYNSLLDSALRIFDFDGNEIAYNDDNTAMNGVTETVSVGSQTRTFHQRDARVVFNVQAGQRYFVQVESGALAAILAGNTSEVDWRGALGSYELLINTMPDLGFVDDHVNGGVITNPQATVIAMDGDLGSPTNGSGSVTGIIDHNNFNAVDTDLFMFVAPSSGSATIRITPSGGTLNPIVQLFDATGELVGQAVGGGAGASASFNALLLQGERFFVRVAGSGGTEGAYTVTIDGTPFVDDHADAPNFYDATELDVYDFTSTTPGSGTIDFIGDSDVFRFATNGFPAGDGLIHLTVNGVSNGFTPKVTVYEVNLDRTDDGFPQAVAGETHPVLLQIAAATATPGDDSVELTFAISAPPRRSLIGDISDRTFNSYYIVISGAVPETDTGDYEMSLTNFVVNDDHPDAGQYAAIGLDNDSVIAIDLATGDGEASGEIEIGSDTDLFRFTAESAGRSRISVTSPAGSLLLLSVQIFKQVGTDADGNPTVVPVADVTTGEFTRNAPDTANSTARFTIDTEREGVYFVLVSGRTGGVVKTSNTGAYTIDVNTPSADDHANETEWDFATEIVLSPYTGDGVQTGVITQDFSIDTDLFTFTSLVADNMSVSVVTPSSGFEVTMRLFRADFSEIGSVVVDGGEGDLDANDGRIRRRISTDGPGETYFILISANSPAFLPGSYTLTVSGAPSIPTDDDHANAGEWDFASRVSDERGLSPYTGDGQINGNIDTPDDTDLFFFTSLAGSPERPQKAFVEVVAPKGSPLNVAMTVYHADGTPVEGQSSVIPGVKAHFTFEITGANQKFFILVDDTTGALGEYTVKVDTAPETFYLYYPEGFASSTIREYVTVANPNDFDVNYTIKIRYANEALGEVVLVDNATLAAGRRGGITISNGPDGRAPGVVAGRAYAIIVESDGPMGATLSHYDFGASLGESFTSTTSTIWSFARGQRFPGEVEDFVVFYNPNPTAARITVTAYKDGVAAATLTTTIGGMRRGGFSFDDETTLPLGEFAFTVTSEPVNPEDDHIGIVASLSHYDLANTTGYALLGDPTGGSVEGVIAGLRQSAERTAELTFFNPSNTPTVVTIRGSYIGTNLPDLTRVLTIPALSSLTFTGEQLAIVEDQPIGIRYEATSPIVALGSERLGQADAHATSPSTQLASAYFFGDAFINSRHAGTLYLETLTFYNPSAAPLAIDVTLIYFDGTVVERTVNVTGDGFAALDLHALQEILDRNGNNFFSVQVAAPRPFAAVMSHYDLYLGGGWATSGAPFGLQNPLSLLS